MKVVFQLFISSFLLSQSDFTFRNISVEDGLSESTVKVVFEDHQGFIYFGTENGLDFYDGYKFHNYQMHSFDEASILGNKISSIYEDSNNKIWVGTVLGVSKFEPDTRRFSRPIKLDPKAGLAISNPKTIVEDRNGNIWINLFDNNQLFQFSPTQDTTRCMNCEKNDPLFNIVVTALYEDKNKTIWFGTDAGLFYYDLNEIIFCGSGRGGHEFLQHPITTIEQGAKDILWVGTTNGLAQLKTAGRIEEAFFYQHGPNENSIVSDFINDLDWNSEKNELWVATKNGLSQYKPESKTFHNTQVTPYANSIIENDISKLIVAEKSNKLWFTTENYPGINCRMVEKDPYFGELDTSFTHFEHDKQDDKSLADNNVSTFIEDRAGHVWIGTRENGISFYSFVKPKFYSIKYDAENEWGLKSDKIFSIATLSNGYLWAGTGFGLELLSPDGIRDYDMEKSNLGIRQVLDLEIVNDEVLWAATSDGVLRIDLNTDESIRYSSGNEAPESRRIIDDLVYDVLMARDGSIWLGTRAGLAIIDPESDKINNFASDLVPRIMAEDSKGNIWFGIESNGLYYIPADSIPKVKTGAGFEVSGYVFDEDSSEGISSARITCIAEDDHGVIWAGTANGGLNKLDAQGESFTHYFVSDGLPSNYITAIAVDDNNHLWISTKNGISHFNTEDESFTNYGTADGIGNIDFFRNSYSISEDGNFYFGGPKGITVVNPGKMQYNDYQPPCIITRIKKTTFDGDVYEQFEGLVQTKQLGIEIDHRIKSFSIDFVALNYHKTEKNKYRYRLENLDKNWVDSDGLRFASYNNLGRGLYQFFVQGSNDDGLWSEPSEISIKFIPHPLLSGWALGVYFIVIMVGVYVFVKHRMHKQKHELEEERRIKELEQAREFQMSLIPQAPPEHPDYDIALHMKTSTEVGGDYYDFFPQDDGSMYVVCGDATGHGLNAGMMVSITKAGLYGSSFDTPASTTTRLNQTIKAIDLGTTRMSLNMVKFNNGSFDFTSAGMPPAYLYKDKTGSVDEILIPGLPLGSMKKADFDLHSFPLDSNDVLVLISDGLPECVNHEGEMLDYDPIKDCIELNGDKSAKDIIDALIDLGDKWMSGLTNDDDITLVVIKRK